MGTFFFLGMNSQSSFLIFGLDKMESLAAVTTPSLGAVTGGSALGGGAGEGESAGAVTFAGSSAEAVDWGVVFALSESDFFVGGLDLDDLGFAGTAGFPSFFAAPLRPACHAGTWEAALLGRSFFASGCLE